MHKLYFKKTIILISLSVFNTSYAEPSCYMPMRSLNLSVEPATKQVCEEKTIAVEPIKTDAEKSDAELEESTIGMDAYFVYPHMENVEEEPTADGIGVGVNVGF